MEQKVLTNYLVAGPETSQLSKIELNQKSFIKNPHNHR